MLRDFHPADQAAVRAVVLAGMEERWGADFDPNANGDLDDIWSAYVVGRRAEVVVVEQDGSIVASGILVSDDEAIGELVRIAVIRQQRRKGIAVLMVNELLRRARQNGMKKVRVMTDRPWADAVALYLACGFRVVEADSTTVTLAIDLAPHSSALR